ncbi:MAG: hypothetical protein EBV03_06300 [Proteobacteria bacterium]|nr:hypothetical protein [Pseudomonadota bacterium]
MKHYDAQFKDLRHKDPAFVKALFARNNGELESYAQWAAASNDVPALKFAMQHEEQLRKELKTRYSIVDPTQLLQHALAWTEHNREKAAELPREERFGAAHWVLDNLSPHVPFGGDAIQHYMPSLTASLQHVHDTELFAKVIDVVPCTRSISGQVYSRLCGASEQAERGDTSAIDALIPKAGERPHLVDVIEDTLRFRVYGAPNTSFGGMVEPYEQAGAPMVQNVLNVMDKLIERGHGIEGLVEKLRTPLSAPADSKWRNTAKGVVEDIQSVIRHENQRGEKIKVPARVQAAFECIRAESQEAGHTDRPKGAASWAERK